MGQTKAWKATITEHGKEAKTVLIGAPSIISAAKKASDEIGEDPKKEVVSLELTDTVILSS